MEAFEENSANWTLLRKAEKTVEVLTRENEALRTVLARLHHENIRLAESLLKATSNAKVAVSSAETSRDEPTGVHVDRV